MQQEAVLTELHANQDSPSVKYTLKYLTACNMMFERGLLSHERVSSHDTKVIDNISSGYSFFSDWLQKTLAKGTYIPNTMHASYYNYITQWSS